ncbi:KINESIN LIGHT CHAIN-RELATED 2-like protein [Drosera capensis]
MDGGACVETSSNHSGSLMNFKTTVGQNTSSPRSPFSTHSTGSDSIDLTMYNTVDNSIARLYDTIYEMQSSDQSCSPSMRSYTTFGNESRIDAQLNLLVGAYHVEEAKEVLKEVVAEQPILETGEAKPEEMPKKAGLTGLPAKSRSFPSKIMTSLSKTLPGVLDKISASHKSVREKPPLVKKDAKFTRRSVSASSFGEERRRKTEDIHDAGSENPDIGPYLLKKARDLIASGDNSNRAFELALRAKKSFEKCAKGKPNLEYVMCLHFLAALCCRSGQYEQAIPLLQRSIEIPKVEMGKKHALTKFAGGMCWEKKIRGLERPGAEAHVQALQFDEAEKLCQLALDIRKENSSPMSLAEASDRRLMGLICDSKANHDAALQHYVLASMAMSANGQETDKAAIDCNIGDAYLLMARYDEAVFSYQKALTVLKTSKGENHPAVAYVYVRLAELYNKIGKFKEFKSYSANAHRIYENPPPAGVFSEEIASGLVNLAAIYESMQELEQALDLLQKGLSLYSKRKGQQSTMAGIEAQMGAIAYMLGNYSDSYNHFKNAIAKFQACGDKKTALCGITLNQMGLACVQLCAIAEAVERFEEARSILEQEFGPCHPEMLGVYSNLAGTYDAIGRWDDAIEILEFLVGMREEKVGTADPIVDGEKQRLAELLREAGRVRGRKSRSLETLLHKNPQTDIGLSYELI